MINTNKKMFGQNILRVSRIATVSEESPR